MTTKAPLGGRDVDSHGVVRADKGSLSLSFRPLRTRLPRINNSDRGRSMVRIHKREPNCPNPTRALVVGERFVKSFLGKSCKSGP